jgi:hypothetical protein
MILSRISIRFLNLSMVKLGTATMIKGEVIIDSP